MGLPTLEDEKAGNGERKDKVWVHFAEDNLRLWVPWTELKELRRSPAKHKVSKTGFGTDVKTTKQTSLFGSDRPQRLPGSQQVLQRPVFDSAGLEMNSWEGASGSGTAGVLPPLAEHERARVIPQLPPAGVRGRSVGPAKTKESKVSVVARIAQHPNQGLRDSGGKPWCGPCKQYIPNLSQDFKQHYATKKHKDNLSKCNAATHAARPISIC